MELSVLNIFTAKGDPVDLAAYTIAVLEFLKAKVEHDENKKVMRDLGLNDLFRSFEEMMKAEQQDGEDE